MWKENDGSTVIQLCGKSGVCIIFESGLFLRVALGVFHELLRY